MKLFRKFEKDMQKIGSEFQENLEKLNAQELHLVNKFFAGDSPFLVTLESLGEISKMTPESAADVGIASMLRPEYEKLEKLSNQINAKKKELSSTEMGFSKKIETFNQNHTKMVNLLNHHRELLSTHAEMKLKFRDLRYVFDELEVINNNIIAAANRGEEIGGDLSKIELVLEELLETERQLEEIQIKAHEKSDIIEATLEEIVLEEQKDEQEQS